MKSNLKGSLILILCALIWGMAFAAQGTAANYIGPFTFVFLRSAITSVVLLAAYPLFRKGASKREDAAPGKRRYLAVGCMLGVLLFVACALQQIGIAYTTAAKSGFITALYIVMIPLIGLLMGRRIGRRVWIGVCVALVGLCLLCLKDDLSVNTGDLITLGCALVFSLHIICIDKYAAGLNPVLLSGIQFAVGALAALPVMLATETPSMDNIRACWTSLIYAAVFSGAIGYTLQFVGQKYAEPTLASLLLCLESVFAALGGWLILGQGLLPRELLGCALMLSASVIAQLPEKKRVPERA